MTHRRLQIALESTGKEGCIVLIGAAALGIAFAWMTVDFALSLKGWL